uniref:Putative CRN13-like protein n=1 Tax=Lagenidium giganteum TaxID=4803 RepID=A0A1D8QLQ8_9STRA|nr:putative CRN13-like protein [Lagenidium giganteum]
MGLPREIDAMTREVWFQLVDGEGKAVTSADRVKELDDEAKVVDLRDAVFSKVSRALPANVIAADLTVFANRAAYDAKQALEEDSPIGSFGGSKKDALTVQVPKKEQRSVLWLVRGSIVNALSTKGVRCRLYRLAGTYLGYYDPARRTGDKDSALWYEDKTLCIHILFETKENALRFDNALQEEPVTLGSPLNGQEVTTSVAQVEGVQTELKRIYLIHYDPQESESPQDTMSSISLTSSVSILDASTDEFRYQRIEHERYFLPYGNAESCHLVSRKQSRDHKREFAKYDRDTNNRLALSREMDGFYDGLSYDVPIVNMIPGSVEQNRSIGNRYKVEVFVKVLDAQCKDRVFSRLKEGATQTDDPLVMKTFVHVEDPETFCFCMRWKHDDNDECWKNFLSMTPAAD